MSSTLCGSQIFKKSIKEEYNSASIIIPCKNEEGNIEQAIKRLPKFSKNLEVIFVEGNSKDKTWEKIQS